MRKCDWQILYFALAMSGALVAAPAQAQVAGGASQQVVMNEQLVTTYQPVQRRVVVPVREWKTETRTHGWWNPFSEPHVATHYVPKLRWEERIETSFVPITHKQYSAQTQATQTPSPALVLAKPLPWTATPVPTVSAPPVQIAARPRQMQDNPPLVPVSSAGTTGAGTIRQAQAPTSTLVPRTNATPAPTRSSPYGGVQAIDNDPTRSGLRAPVFSR